jgi:hypothetical protein
MEVVAADRPTPDVSAGLRHREVAGLRANGTCALVVACGDVETAVAAADSGAAAEPPSLHIASSPRPPPLG